MLKLWMRFVPSRPAETARTGFPNWTGRRFTPETFSRMYLGSASLWLRRWTNVRCCRNRWQAVSCSSRRYPVCGKLDVTEGDEVVLDRVLLVSKDGEVKVGTPYVEGAKVVAQAVKQGKGKKIIVFKYRAKKNYRKKRGHRQPYTKLEIKAIQA